jgi:membrane fusion protein (multidrug efflux system)
MANQMNDELEAPAAVEELPSTPPANRKTERNVPQRPAQSKGRLRRLIVFFVLGLLALGAFLFWRQTRVYETTDDAQIECHLNAVSSRVEGTITTVHVEENQHVDAGQLIAEIDPKDYQVAVDQAQAQLMQAQAQFQADRPNVPITEVSNQTSITSSQAEVANAEASVAVSERDYETAVAKLREAEANSAKAQADVARYRPLVQKDEVAREQFDQVTANAQALAATVDANRAAVASAQKTVDQKKAQLDEARSHLGESQNNAPHQLAIRRANLVTRQASAQVARAQLERAQLDLSYCKIIAPVSGIISKRSVEVGQRVSAGQQLVLIAKTDDLWVTANFKETQLKRMRPGQRVSVRVDAFDMSFDGTVQSMPAATGAVTSLLPPENATGNYVKVVQRLPVRIRFKAGQSGLDRLRPGMSAEPKVFVE